MGAGWQSVLSVLAGLLLVWLGLVGALLVVARQAPDHTTLKDVLRLVPDVVRLVRRLAADTTLPRGVRVRLWLLMAYLLLPIDLVPDFLPVVGYADDAVVIALVLRSVTRVAGPRHSSGTGQEHPRAWLPCAASSASRSPPASVDPVFCFR